MLAEMVYVESLRSVRLPGHLHEVGDILQSSLAIRCQKGLLTLIGVKDVLATRTVAMFDTRPWTNVKVVEISLQCRCRY